MPKYITGKLILKQQKWNQMKRFDLFCILYTLRYTGTYFSSMHKKNYSLKTGQGPNSFLGLSIKWTLWNNRTSTNGP